MKYVKYNDSDVLPTIAKTTAGQAVDMVSPKVGLAYHVVATATAKNPIDLALGVLGIIGSSSKISDQNKRNV